MYGGKSSRPWAYRDLRSHVTLAVQAVAAAGAILLLTSHGHAPLVLPMLSMASLALAGGVALIAWWRGCERQSARITFWDLSGAFALIGCAAAMLSEPESVLRLLDQAIGH